MEFLLRRHCRRIFVLVALIVAHAEENFLRLDNSYHYCESSSIIHAATNPMPLKRVIQTCSLMHNCSFGVQGPQYPNLAANWFCSNHDSWESLENKKGWSVVVKDSTFARDLPTYTVTANTRAGCGDAALAPPVVGPFTLKSLGTMCNLDDRCMGFTVDFSATGDPENLPAPAFRQHTAQLCSELIGRTERRNGWVTAYKSRPVEAGGGASTAGSVKPWKPSLPFVPAPKKRRGSGKTDSGSITQDSYNFDVPEKGVLMAA